MKEYTLSALKDLCEQASVKAFVERVQKEYADKFEGKEIVTPSYSNYKRIALDGNRKAYEKEYFELRTRLAYLEVLAVCDDQYLADLEEVLSRICDSFTWVLPAHAYTQNGAFDYHKIDLFSAETAFYLAEAAVVFHEKLYPDLVNRIRASVEEKVFKLLDGKGNWWKTCDNNWAAVCAGSLGAAYLYLRPERFEEVAPLVFGCMERFLSGFDEGGVCQEGIGYWQYGFGFFALFYDVYQKRTGIRAEILDTPKVKNILKYSINACLEGDIYLPFADGGTASFVPSADTVYAVKNLFPEYALPKIQVKITEKALGFRILEGLAEYGEQEERATRDEFTYYKDSEVYIRRADGFVFTAKGGHNDELHNHNDVGAFELVAGGKRIVTDIGAGEYTWEYFNLSGENGRYGKKIFVCSALAHSVPIVDGKEQVAGRIFRGKVLCAGEEEFRLDIAGAYKNPIEKLEVCYRVEKKGLRVSYQTKGANTIAFRFVCEYEPKKKDGFVEIEGVKLTASKDLPVEICAEPYSTHAAQENKAYTVDFIASGADAERVEFFFEV